MTKADEINEDSENEYRAIEEDEEGYMLTGNTFGYRGCRFPPFFKGESCRNSQDILPACPTMLCNGENCDDLWDNFSADTIHILRRKYRYTVLTFTIQVFLIYCTPWMVGKTEGGLLVWYPLLLMVLVILIFYYNIVLDCPILYTCLRMRRRLLELEEVYAPLFADQRVKVVYVFERVPACFGLGISSITYWSFQSLAKANDVEMISSEVHESEPSPDLL